MVFIINSAPGIGKSSLLSKLHTLLPDNFAILDGDDLGRVTPYKNSIEWLNLIQDNMATCCNNFRIYGKGNIILSFVFPNEGRLNRLKDILNKLDFSSRHIKLTCDNEAQKERIMTRNSQKMISIEKATLINEQIYQMKSDFALDTTLLTPQETADMVLKYLVSGSETLP
jgi:hypothetical protein